MEIAKSILEGRGFRVYQEDAIDDATVPEGAVSKQDPVPGGKVRKGSTIKIWPNGGGSSVPVLQGMLLPQATVMLQQAGLKLRGQVTMQPSDSVPKDAIISSNPSFNSKTQKDSPVDLVVSAGAGEVAVQAVKGYGKSRSQEMMEQGLNLGSVRYIYDEENDPGLVVRQDPQGSKVAKGSNVSIWVTTDIEPEE